MEEHSPATPPTPPAEVRTVVFAPRIDTALKEQIEGLRGITGQTINQVGQEALQGWVASKLADEGICEQAMAELGAEQQRLKERRESIERVLGSASASGEQTQSSGRGGGRRKSQD
jgi:hypothetical protein